MTLHTTHVDWFGLGTIFALVGASFVALLSAVLVPRALRRLVAAGVSAVGFTAGMVLSIWLYVDSTDGHTIVSGAFYRDRWTALGQIILCGIGLATTFVAVDHVPGWRRTSDHSRRDDHVAEFYALLLASAAGMAFFVGAGNLMTLFLSLEWFSIALYVMCAIDYDLEGSLEAGLKYLIVGSFGAAALLFGSALVYGATGTISFHGIATAVATKGLTGDTFLVLGLGLIVAGLGFKMSAAPFHMWTPDVYEGAPTTVTAWMSSATKVAALLLTFRLMTTAFPHDSNLWGWAFAIIATASLAIGNLAALVQRNVKRILAYSSISHAGFMLIGLSAGSALGGRALMYYLVPYSAMAFGSFAIVAARERELGVPVTLENLAGFGWERPFLGVAMWFFMFGFAGLPARRRLRRQVLRPRGRLPARLGLARDRRRARDAREPLLLPGSRASDVHAPLGGAAGAAWWNRRRQRRRTAEGKPPQRRCRSGSGGLRRLAFRCTAADRARAPRRRALPL